MQWCYLCQTLSVLLFGLIMIPPTTYCIFYLTSSTQHIIDILIFLFRNRIGIIWSSEYSQKINLLLIKKVGSGGDGIRTPYSTPALLRSTRLPFSQSGKMVILKGGFDAALNGPVRFITWRLWFANWKKML